MKIKGTKQNRSFTVIKVNVLIFHTEKKFYRPGLIRSYVN